MLNVGVRCEKNNFSSQTKKTLALPFLAGLFFCFIAPTFVRSVCNQLESNPHNKKLCCIVKVLGIKSTS